LYTSMALYIVFKTSSGKISFFEKVAENH